MPKSLISIQDFSKDEVLHILEVAKEFEANREQNFLAGKVVACLFFEPSTRTRLSFEAAVNRLGARVIGFPDNRNTSQTKGETLEDTIKIVSNYVDMIVMRHPQAGAADIAASVASVPVINAGDGANQHPTQTLLDLYAIQKTQGKLNGLTVNMVGDLKYGRAVHSLVEALRWFDPHFIFTSPEELNMPKKYLELLDREGVDYRQTDRIEDGLNICDVLYMTRVQQERFPDMDEVAVYGKGGIGKSTVTSNLAAAFANMGKRVIQIGCDPKADSTINLLGGEPLRPVMNYMREEDEEPDELAQISKEGYGGILCIETGGPTPGLGCAGRGIIATFQLLEDMELFEHYKPDVVLYDVLGDVVCGGFAAPIREGYADKVLIVTSGEKMALYAANNISSAVRNFEDRSYARHSPMVHPGGLQL